MSHALYSLTLEQDVIGAILESKTAFDAVSGIVNDADFYDMRHAFTVSRRGLPVASEPIA